MKALCLFVCGSSLLAVSPAYRGSYTSSYCGPCSSNSVGLPVSTVDGDIIVVYTYTSPSGLTVSAPDANWHSIGSPVSSGSGWQANLFWKRALSEPATWSFTSSASASGFIAQTISVSGAVASGSPLDGFSSAVQTTTSPSAPSFGTTTADTLLLWMSFAAFATAALDSLPAGYTSRDNNYFYDATKPQATAGATGAATAASPVSATFITFNIAIASTAPVGGTRRRPTVIQ